jgi:hypothetical protein
MKNIVTTLLLSISLSFVSADLKSENGHKVKYDSLSCLLIEGRVSSDNEDEGEFVIELITSDGMIDSLLLKEGKKKFKFVLSKDAYYALRISKKGYISKFISVNTEIDIEPEGIYKFNFEISLLREEALTRLNDDAIDFPVAIVHFDYENDCFAYNKEYTNNLKKELYKAKPSKTRIAPVIYTNKSAMLPTKM